VEIKIEGYDLKALLISDNPDVSEQLRRMLKTLHNDLATIIVHDENTAIQTAAADGPFGFFIIDIESKEVDPNKLATNFFDLMGPRPIIFWGNDMLIGTRVSDEVFNANASNAKLLNPLERDDFFEDLKQATAKALEWSKEEEFEASIEELDPAEFVPMKIKSFYLFNTFPYDIYMEVTSGHYLKIISAKKIYNITTLANYAKKNVRYLHIRKNDHLKYLDDEAKKCLKALAKVHPESQDIFIVLLRSITIQHQFLLALGASPIVIELTNAIVECIINICDRNQNNIKNILKTYPHLYEGIASKSLLTAFISTTISNDMGWNSQSTKNKLIAASLLQDYNLPDESLTKINHLSDPRLTSFSESLIEQYISHPFKVAEVARQFTQYPDIDFIIENHHELPNRRGFPNQVTQAKLTAVNAVFNVSQYFASEIDGQIYNPVHYDKVLKSMTKDFNFTNFKECLKTLRKYLVPVKAN
jgi:hypothetical protein